MTALDSVAGDTSRTVERTEIPFALIDLRDLTVRVSSQAALRHLGMTNAALRGTSVLDIVAGRDRPAATAALVALRDGVIDSYHAHRELGDPSVAGVPTALWVRAVDLDGERLALVEVGIDADVRSALTALAGREPHEMAIGCLDDQWTVTSVSRGVELLAISTDLVGSNLLDFMSTEDRSRLVAARLQLHGTADSVSLQTEMRSRNHPHPTSVRIVMTLLDSEQVLFIVMPATDTESPGGRVALLEGHLRAVAREVEASGVLRNTRTTISATLRTPLDSLTARQWEVLSRLLGGDRVPTIAAELFLSRSTVRNHLSAIFERFGVHSQAELLALLRDPTDTVSS